MRFFSWRITLTHITLAVVALYLAHWQWERHLEKKAYIAEVQGRVQLPVISSAELLSAAQSSPAELLLRRVNLSGTYEYDHEILIRNRKRGDVPGLHVVTPLRIDGSELRILVSRGFIPYSFTADDRLSQIRRPAQVELIGLIKESMSGRAFGPTDRAPAPGAPPLRQWLRVDIPEVQKQMPFTLLPVFVEEMGEGALDGVSQQMVEAGGGGARDDLLLLANKEVSIFSTNDQLPGSYPIPTFDTVIPPGRHLGYVFEWSFIALVILLLGVWRQNRPPRRAK